MIQQGIHKYLLLDFMETELCSLIPPTRMECRVLATISSPLFCLKFNFFWNPLRGLKYPQTVCNLSELARLSREWVTDFARSLKIKAEVAEYAHC
jgi:hypothetical protein